MEWDGAAVSKGALVGATKPCCCKKSASASVAWADAGTIKAAVRAVVNAVLASQAAALDAGCAIQVLLGVGAKVRLMAAEYKQSPVLSMA